MGLESLTVLSLIITAISKTVVLEGAHNNIGQKNRVVGGETAEEGFAPYQISLLKLDTLTHSCGGAILNEEWVLTASHCVAGRKEEELGVVTGTNNWKKPGAIYKVNKIYKHCRHNSPIYANDIALIHLQSPVKFNNRTQPVPLPTQPMKDGADVILTGWGSTELWGGSVKHLQKVNLQYVAYENCLKLINIPDNLDVGHICTFTRKGQGACHGDSGGPLISDGYLVGLVNWGSPCATGVPDAHANVYYYRDWIRRIISGNSKC